MIAEWDAPFELADGTKINPDTGAVIKDKVSRGGFTLIPNAVEAVDIVAKTRRSVAELPVPSSQMNVLSLILFYTMWGLNDQDIATAIGSLSVAQVKNVKKLPEYQTLQADIKSAVLDHEANDIRTYLQQNATRAAERIVEFVEEDGALGFAASKDLLDRAGHRPADVVEHRHSMVDSLKIEVIERRVDTGIPEVAIETTFRDVTPEK